MTGRPRRGRTLRHTPAPAPELRSSEFPAVISFVRGYLHEDFPEVHGSAHAALAAFCADATEDERRKLAEELEALVAIAERLPMRDLRRFVTRDLGSRWEPRSRVELVELRNSIRAAG